MEFELDKIVATAKDLGFKVTVNSENPGFTFVDKEDDSKIRITYEQMEKLIDSKLSMSKAVERQLQIDKN